MRNIRERLDRPSMGDLTFYALVATVLAISVVKILGTVMLDEIEAVRGLTGAG